MIKLFSVFDPKTTEVNRSLCHLRDIWIWLHRLFFFFFSPVCLAVNLTKLCHLHWEGYSHSQKSFLLKKMELGKGGGAGLENKTNPVLFCGVFSSSVHVFLLLECQMCGLLHKAGHSPLLSFPRCSYLQCMTLSYCLGRPGCI